MGFRSSKMVAGADIVWVAHMESSFLINGLRNEDWEQNARNALKMTIWPLTLEPFQFISDSKHVPDCRSLSVPLQTLKEYDTSTHEPLSCQAVEATFNEGVSYGIIGSLDLLVLLTMCKTGNICPWWFRVVQCHLMVNCENELSAFHCWLNSAFYDMLHLKWPCLLSIIGID